MLGGVFIVRNHRSLIINYLFISLFVSFIIVLPKTVGATEMWQQTYGGTERDAAGSLVQTGDGGYALAGLTESFDVESTECWLVKTDGSGNMEWNQTYGGTGTEYVYSLVQTGDGGYALAGGTESFGAGNSDFLLVKTDEHGVIPEFPSWVILPLFIITTLFAITFKKRLFHQSS